MLRLCALLVTLAALLPVAAPAQTLATLVADRIEVTARGTLEASGHVEVFHEGTRLSAARISYDRANDLLLIDGPIYIVTSSGDVFAATMAELDPRLENGILRGARLVLDRQLQLAASRIDRVDGRLSQLSRVVATSCSVCSGRAPLWEIRARRVVHDEEAQQLHFEGASLRIRGLPVLWLPWMRLPDPTLDRAAGMMVPELRITSTLGAGLAVPVFIPLGRTRDLQLTPYVSALTRTLEARFRHALVSGSYEIRGAVSDDDLAGGVRGYVAARGEFLPRPGTRLSFNLTVASDRAYLGDYGISGADRLPSRLAFSRVRADSLLTADLTLWQSLRAGESSRSLPPVILGADWERRLPLGPGMLTLSAETLAFARLASGSGDDARDVLRIGAGADWRGSALLPGGLVLDGEAGLALQWRRVTDDPAWDESMTSARPHAGLVIRYPLVRHSGASVQMLEPALALGWSRRFGADVPAEDAARRDLDLGNILSPLRGAGEDREPPGASAAALVTWTRTDSRGTASLAFGALVEEARPEPRWLVSGAADLGNGLHLTGRALFDQDLALEESETILGWQHARFDLNARHLWLAPGPGGAAPAVSEFWAGGAWRISDAWEIRLGGRYDALAHEPIDADLGLGWANECVTVDVSLSHRYTEAGASDPATRLGLSVRLTGFSTGGAARRTATCTG